MARRDAPHRTPPGGASKPEGDGSGNPKPAVTWRSIAALVLVAAGLAISVYLTYEHFTASKTLACPNRGTLNCEQVTTSDQAWFLGIPVAVLGLAYFVGMGILLLPFLDRWPDPRLRRPLGWLRIAGGVTGVVFVLYLIYAELFLVNAICLWCTAVHAITLVLFAVLALDAASGSDEPSP